MRYLTTPPLATLPVSPCRTCVSLSSLRVSSHPRLVFATKKSCPSPSLLLLQRQSSTSQATGAASKTTPRTTTTRMDISGPNKANARVAEEGQREKKFPATVDPRKLSHAPHLPCAASRARPIPIRAGCFSIQADLQNRWTSFGLRGPLTARQIFKNVPSHLLLVHRSAKRGSLRPRPPSGSSPFHPWHPPCFNQDHIH